MDMTLMQLLKQAELCIQPGSSMCEKAHENIVKAIPLVDELQTKIAELEKSESDLIGERDRREDQLQNIDVILGGTGGWSNNYDCGDEALKRAGQLQTDHSRLKKLFVNDNLWSISKCLEVLAIAAEHLLNDHDCDADNYEISAHAVTAAKNYMTQITEATKGLHLAENQKKKWPTVKRPDEMARPGPVD